MTNRFILIVGYSSRDKHTHSSSYVKERERSLIVTDKLIEEEEKTTLSPEGFVRMNRRSNG